MDGLLSGYGSNYAKADFDDAQAEQDVNGDFTNSENYISMAATMENLIHATSNLIEEEFILRNSTKAEPKLDEMNARNIIDFSMDSNSNRIRANFVNIKKKLVSVGCAGQLEQIEKFLLPLSEQNSFIRLKEISDKLNRNDFNPFGTEIFKELNIDISGCSFFKDEFGIEISELRSHLIKVGEKYNLAYTDLFEADTTITKKISVFTELSKKFNLLLSLEANDASLEVFASFNKYLSEFFKEQNILEYFNKFVIARKRFIIFRDLLRIVQTTIRNSENIPETSMCAICMTTTVSLAFVPCGHTFCLSCGNKQVTQCYICRSKVQSKMKIYFS